VPDYAVDFSLCPLGQFQAGRLGAAQISARWAAPLELARAHPGLRKVRPDIGATQVAGSANKSRLTLYRRSMAAVLVGAVDQQTANGSAFLQG
jgi:hypothetical protein